MEKPTLASLHHTHEHERQLEDENDDHDENDNQNGDNQNVILGSAATKNLLWAIR